MEPEFIVGSDHVKNNAAIIRIETDDDQPGGFRGCSDNDIACYQITWSNWPDEPSQEISAGSLL